MEGISDDDDDDEGEVSEATEGSNVSEPALPSGSGGPDTGLAVVQDLESPDIQASQPSPNFGSDEENEQDVVPASGPNPKSESATPDIDLETKNQRIKELQLMISRTKKEQVSLNFDLYSSSMFSVIHGLLVFRYPWLLLIVVLT